MTRVYLYIGLILLTFVITIGWMEEEIERVESIVLLPKADASVVIDGYPRCFSAYQGERLRFYLNLKYDADVTLKLVDVSETIVDSVNFFGYIQDQVKLKSYAIGFNYERTFTYSIPRKLKSGLYHWKGTEIWFLVKEKKKSAPIVIVYPSNTEQAYNNAGGKSLYDFNSTDGKRSHIVSFQRPINYRVTPTQDIHEFTKGFLSWLLDTDYKYRLIADSDLDDARSLENAKVVIVIGHSEYWSRDARANLDTFNLRGGNVAIFSGNTMWWQVRYMKNQRNLVCYKDSVLDPTDNILLETVEWGNEYLNYSVLNSIGADFAHGGYGSKPDNGWDGYRILLPNSPLLKGTNLAYYGTLPLRTHEFDGTLLKTETEDNIDPVPDISTLGAYRLEIIGYDLGHCHYVGCRSVATFIVYQRTPTAGQIVNTASTNWCSTEAFYGVDATLIRTVTRNILTGLLENTDVFSVAEKKAGI